MGTEDGGVEAGAILAGLGTVLNDHLGERGVDIAVCANDHKYRNGGWQ